MAKEKFPTIDIRVLCDIGQDEIMVSRFSDYFNLHHKNLDHPHRHNFYHLVYFTEGSGNHTIDFTKFEVQPRQIYFMHPGQVHSWDFDGKVEGFLVNFTDSFFQSFLLKVNYIDSFSFFRGIAPAYVLNLTDETDRRIVPIFRGLLGQASLKTHCSMDLMRVMLLEIFLRIEQENPKQYANKSIHYQNDSILDNYHKLIEKHFLEFHLPGHYADLLSVTPNHLNAICKEHLGMKAGDLIRKRILLEAKRLLVNLELTISQVAYTLNFSDNSYFTKFFKRHTGQTPEEFRSSHR